MAKIFDGVDDLIDRSLGITQVGTASPHYRCKQAALGVLNRPVGFNAAELLAKISFQLETNLNSENARWLVKGPSKENWRWTKNLNWSLRAKVDEKTIEKLISQECGPDWVNQVPTASGLLNHAGEKSCSIDLVWRIREAEYEFIELKYRDSTPLFAAFEVVKYGMLYLLSRKHVSLLGYTIAFNPLLWAKVVHLVVLAPPEFYLQYKLKWLEDDLLSALECLGYDDLTIKFRFDEMPWPQDLNCRDSIERRRPVYPS